MTDTSSIDIEIPDLSTLSDDQISQLFQRKDGRWSRSTKALVCRFGAQKLELNEAWANEGPEWDCPICHRRKRDIARLSSRGTLLAKLEVHHDHIHDFIGNLLQKDFGNNWPKQIPEGTYEIEHLGSQIIERFDKVVVCTECNLADAYIKQQLAIDRYFSFRPSEIAQFITSSPNSTHEYIVDRAREIWETERADFEERLRLGAIFIGYIRNGQIRRERNMRARYDNSTSAFLRCELHNPAASLSARVDRSLSEMSQKLRQRSVSRP
jgi:hypothetical protein